MNILNNFNIFHQNKYENKTNNCLNCPINREFSFKGALTADCFEKSFKLNQKTESGIIHFLKDKTFSSFDFNQPVSLEEAFDVIKELQEKFNIHKYGLPTHQYVYKSYKDVFGPRFKDIKFSRYLGAGNSAIAIETTEGKVLKLSENNHFGQGRKTEEFDAPVYESGQIGDFHHYYFQKKCSTKNITEENVEEIKNRIEAKGYNSFDLSKNQLGKANGKVYLIDPECAVNIKELEKIKKEAEKWALEHGLDFDYI